ncbi:asparagine synthase (glutamine-hydrolyzing) [[Clostridium] polysaccharolyticum]|uniref:asparagine synthase (glutamine-hydrolyzing) n=1 Tax=[Clostridium] polysaccharolyticum TaxID=29364 RepID=A0A1I0BEQ8_9FIRM|nr:asparagine synthase (glutamine-hydrolyzing) [[Clostridium] polysaccharolyticum]SET05000.1 asparagine synthase (glutamine-hydrolysing) [[Clostridium] polysaccharolyticum]
MCGICGMFNTIGYGEANVEQIKLMTKTFIHRGPDEEGYRITDYYGLGFCRLSIIDLGNGNQPIVNEEHTIYLICNGEIFNYLELRKELIAKGHVFCTNTDVEVLLHLYEEMGEQMLDRINGQFAFAIIDENRQKIFLARDQFGVMPLFYTVIDGVLFFASEIKALLTNQKVKRKVDLTSMEQFFSLPAPVSPRTMFENIKSLQPGHYLIARHNREEIQVHEYWDVVYPKTAESYERHPESYYTEKLEELLLQSVKYRLQADVEVGAFLSGGLDSSLITCMMKALSSEQRKLFSVIFENKDFSEQKYSELVAKKLGYEHHKVLFQTEDVAKRLREVIYHTEAPVKEAYNTATLALSGEARKSGIKVILTGEGSDELFAGYPSYRFDKLRYARNMNAKASKEEKAYREKVWGDPLFKYESDFTELFKIKRELFSSKVMEKYSEFDYTKFNVVNTSKIIGRHPIHQRSYIDMKVRLADHLISDHSDRMLMANSVEGRFPFMDKDLVEFLTKVPPDLKLNNFVEKYILKEVAKKYVPNEIINREKFIFVAPGSPFLLKENFEWINDLLSYERIKRQGYFNPDTVERLKKQYCSSDFSLSTSIDVDYMLMVITFCIFLDVFQMQDL